MVMLVSQDFVSIRVCCNKIWRINLQYHEGLFLMVFSATVVSWKLAFYKTCFVVYVTHLNFMKIPRDKIEGVSRSRKAKFWEEKSVNWIEKAKRGQESNWYSCIKISGSIQNKDVCDRVKNWENFVEWLLFKFKLKQKPFFKISLVFSKC